MNNYTEEEVYSLRETLSEVKWGVFGREVGDNNTPHLQGAVVFQNPRNFEGVKRVLGPRYHIEKMFRSVDTNRTYCMKQGDFEEFGEVPHQGARGDLAEIREMWHEGRAPYEIVERMQNVQQVKAMEACMRYIPRRLPRQPCEVRWFWGESGAGKTTRAEREAAEFETDPNMIWASSVDTGAFMEGYCGQTVVIMDDLTESTYRFGSLLRYLGRDPVVVGIKGNHVDWVPQLIIVTALLPPERMFRQLPAAELFQLTRRVHKCEEVVAPDLVDVLDGLS